MFNTFTLSRMFTVPTSRTDFNNVRNKRAYRKIVLKYHPDKVSGLSVEEQIHAKIMLEKRQMKF